MKTKRAPRSRSPLVANKTGVLICYVCSSIFLIANVISAVFSFHQYNINRSIYIVAEFSINVKKRGMALLGVVPVRIQRQFYSPRRVLLLRSDICLVTSVIAFGSFRANKISLKPKGFNITFDLSKISL